MARNPFLSAVGADSADPTEPAPEPTRMSVGRRWRLRRNLVIYIAARNGVSQRMLADVFDLPRSRIATIIKELRGRYGSGLRPDLD